MGSEVIFGGLPFGLFVKDDFLDELFFDLILDFLFAELMDDCFIKLGFGGLEFHADLVLSGLALVHLSFGPLDGLDSEFLFDFFFDFLSVDFFLELFLPLKSVIFQNGLSLGFVFLKKFFFGVIFDILLQLDSFA